MKIIFVLLLGVNFIVSSALENQPPDHPPPLPLLSRENLIKIVQLNLNRALERLQSTVETGQAQLGEFIKQAEGTIEEFRKSIDTHGSCIEKYEPEIKAIIEAARKDFEKGAHLFMIVAKIRYEDHVAEIKKRIEEAPTFVAECGEGRLPGVIACFRKKHEEHQALVNEVISSTEKVARIADQRINDFREKLLGVVQRGQECFAEG